MKLFVDCHVFDGKFQGTRTYIQGIYTNLLHHKEIDYYFAARDIKNLKRIFGESENVHYITLKSKGSLSRLIFEIPSIIKKYNIDYAHFQYISPLIKNCKEIITIHDLLFIDFPQYFPIIYKIKNNILFRISALKADLLLTVSQYSKERIIEHFGIKSHKIHITPNGVLTPQDDLIIPNIKKKYNIDKYILTVSRIEPRKNHQMLLKAYVELELYKRDIKLVMIGVQDINNNSFNDYYQSLSNNIKENILITQVSYEELVAFYKNALLFVFPSYAEGFGIPPLEATASGCTTLCSNQTAMKDFSFLNNKMFNPYDINELKEKITYYINHKNEFIKKEEEIINKKYNWQNIADDYYKLLINS